MKPGHRLFIQCDCHTEGILVENHEGDFEISFFERTSKYNGARMSFAQRLRHAWKIIDDGHPYADMVVIDSHKALELARFITDELQDERRKRDAADKRDRGEA